MNLKKIFFVYRKEMRDLLRDRRTLRSMVILPLVLMPLTIQGLGRIGQSIANKAKTQAAEIQIIGGADSPTTLAWLRDDRRLHLAPAAADWRQLIADKKIQAVVRLPEHFDANLDTGAAGTVTIYNYDGELRSGVATGELEGSLRRLRDSVVRMRLVAQGLPANFNQPFSTQRENVAPPERVAGNRLGGLIPYIIILLCFFGAIHPAIDLTAGEKERGTMETLLCTPLARTEIVLGKFFMILTCSLSSVLLACLSLVLSFQWLASKSTSGLSNLGLASVAPAGVAGVLLLVLPVAVLFSAMMFALGLWARSHREATSYLQPLVVVILLPAMIGTLPGIDLNARFALIPILNLSLASREMLSGIWHWHFLALVYLSTCVYAAVALAAAVRMFNREEVLFRT